MGLNILDPKTIEKSIKILKPNSISDPKDINNSIKNAIPYQDSQLLDNFKESPNINSPNFQRQPLDVKY